MFHANVVNEDALLSSWESILGKDALEALKLSPEYLFYKLIFSKICEEDFSVLYSAKAQTKNRPVNCLVSTLILLEMKNLSHKEFFNQLKFNVALRVALGLKDFAEVPFVPRTLYNFKNRLDSYNSRMKIDLITKCFTKLTIAQLKELGIKTDIQRLDTVLINSNIKAHTRLSLLVEVLCRLHRILSKEDQQKYELLFKAYLKGGEKYVYGVAPDGYTSKLACLGFVYYNLHQNLSEQYAEEPVFKMFERVFKEHFEVDKDAEDLPIVVRPGRELGSDSLQSPDDLDATYRTKRGEKFQGFGAMGVETCHPDNKLNLITHLATATNNTDDSVILEGEIDTMKSNTPDLNELHTDGGFPSKAVDIKAEQHDINIIQTAVRGKTAQVTIEITGNTKDGFIGNCPNPDQPAVQAEEAGENYKVTFDLNKCIGCPLFDQCPTKAQRNKEKQTATFRFNKEEPLKQKRHKAVQKLPSERRTLRPAVERLMYSLRRGEKHTGKLKIRERFNFDSYIFCLGIAINFERIYHHLNPFSRFLPMTRYMKRLMSMNLLIAYIKY